MRDFRSCRISAVSPNGNTAARASWNRAWLRARNEEGQALLEFAYVVPLLLALVLGIIMFGAALNNYLVLTDATAVGARVLSISRGQTDRSVRGNRDSGRSRSAKSQDSKSQIFICVEWNCVQWGDMQRGSNKSRRSPNRSSDCHLSVQPQVPRL